MFGFKVYGLGFPLPCSKSHSLGNGVQSLKEREREREKFFDLCLNFRERERERERKEAENQRWVMVVME